MLKTLSKNGMLNRTEYYIACRYRSGMYTFSTLRNYSTMAGVDESFVYSSRAGNLADALSEYLQFLEQRVSPEKIKEFYFQGNLVLTITATRKA